MKDEKEFVVVWHYCANYGKNVVRGQNAEEVVKNHLFYGRKDIELLAFENKLETSFVKEKEKEGGK